MYATAMIPRADISKSDYEYERRVLMGELNAWGKWVELHWLHTGYPSLNILASHLGGGGGIAGHRILCLEMPTGVYATNQRVLRLPETEQQAVHIRHVAVLKDDGTVWPVHERCECHGISEEAYRKRLSRAYQRIMGIEPT